MSALILFLHFTLKLITETNKEVEGAKIVSIFGPLDVR